MHEYGMGKTRLATLLALERVVTPISTVIHTFEWETLWLVHFVLSIVYWEMIILSYNVSELHLELHDINENHVNNIHSF